MMVDNPKVAVVTLNWNGVEHLEKFLPTAMDLNYPLYFVVVVDNGSEDNSIDFVRKNFPSVHIIILNKNLGYSKGFNEGINYAIDLGVEYVLITNNDVKLHRDIIKEGIKLITTDKKIGYMSGKIYNLNSNKIFQYAGGRVKENKNHMYSRGAGELDIGQYEEPMDFDYMDDVCSLVSAEMIKNIGAYDEDFFFDFEETEWNVRMKQNGYRIVYNPKMIAWHSIHGSTEGTRYKPLPFFHHWRGKILFHYKIHKGYALFFSLFVLLFKDIPLQWGILIKQKQTFFIYHNIRGIISGFKRIVELKGEANRY